MGCVAAAVFGLAVRLGLAVCLTLGGWLCTRHFPSLNVIPGLVLCGGAVFLWPRAPRISRYAAALDRAEAPDLYALAGRIAAALGAPAPHVIHVDDRFGADVVTHGPLRRRHLILGIPLLAALTPPHRVALLAVQLARFRTRDLLHGPFIGGTDATLEALTAVLTPGPARTPRAAHDTRIVAASMGASIGTGGLGLNLNGGLVWISELVWMPVATVLRSGLTVLRLCGAALVRPTAHRTEYFSDAVAAAVAGTASTIDVLDAMLSAEVLVPRLRALARANQPTSAWPDATGQILADGDERVHRRRSSARREISPLGTRLPLGLRASMLASRPDTPPALTLDHTDNRRIDENLAHHYRQTARDLANGSPLG
ncbi:hypothetical protein DLE60_30995 [Micromonospora globispora]|uniref:Peptidase M48 domain-containing protein n=1 Tax=Micromonospora globispora TaxID=1450148 RepID=A0A317K7K3_9ACTN|nr:hypothetical protein DLJ46_13610 [Micromonospora globispora]PWU53178.1 hypothetical protein DLE60_30995 [Micromonospora globispora]RQW86903.1 hypothetical protein DKL51_26870 [Micromonospora globispora]